MTTIATAYTPKTLVGRNILRTAIVHGTKTHRVTLAKRLRRLRDQEGPFAVRHCLAWLDWIGAYPLK